MLWDLAMTLLRPNCLEFVTDEPVAFGNVCKQVESPRDGKRYPGPAGGVTSAVWLWARRGSVFGYSVWRLVSLANSSTRKRMHLSACWSIWYKWKWTLTIHCNSLS